MQAKNDFEGYILDTRNRLSDELSSYISPSEKEKLERMLTEGEEWLYGDGYDAQKSEYKKRLGDLKAIGDPVVARRYETEHRADAAGSLKQTIGHYQRWASTSDEKSAHITPEERQKVVDECNSVDEWLASTMSKLDRQPKHETPHVTIAQLKAKKDALDKVGLTLTHHRHLLLTLHRFAC